MVGSLTPVLRFIHNGKPVNPSPPRPPSRDALRKGIMFSSNETTGELKAMIKQKNQVTPQEIGDGAVKILKSLGLSVNITV